MSDEKQTSDYPFEPEIADVQYLGDKVIVHFKSVETSDEKIIEALKKNHPETYSTSSYETGNPYID